MTHRSGSVCTVASSRGSQQRPFRKRPGGASHSHSGPAAQARALSQRLCIEIFFYDLKNYSRKISCYNMEGHDNLYLYLKSDFYKLVLCTEFSVGLYIVTFLFKIEMWVGLCLTVEAEMRPFALVKMLHCMMGNVHYLPRIRSSVCYTSKFLH